MHFCEPRNPPQKADFYWERVTIILNVIHILNQNRKQINFYETQLGVNAVEIFVAVSPSGLFSPVANSALASAPASNGVPTLPF